MKKNLLLMATALLVSVSASAQLQRPAKVQMQRPAKVQLQSTENTQLQGQRVKASQRVMEKKAAPMQMMAKEKAAKAMGPHKVGPMKSWANSMYYIRPTGTFYNTFEAQDGSHYCYMVFPNFTDLTYINASSEDKIADTQWLIGETVVEGDENNDLPEFYAIPSGRLNYPPTLQYGQATFTIGEDFNFTQVGVISTDEVMEMTKWDTEQGNTYTGYDTGEYGFGTGVTAFDFDDDGVKEQAYSDGIIEIFDKPARPFYFTGLTLPVISNQLTREEAFPDGKELKVQIVKVEYDEEGYAKLTDEVLTEMTVTADNFTNVYSFQGGGGIYAFLDIQSKEIDDFGVDSPAPIIIDDAFAIVIDGWGQEGIDLGLFFGDAAAATYDWVMMMPTIEKFYDPETGEHKGNLRSYGQRPNGTPLSYNAWIILNGMFDVAYVTEDYQKFVAPIEGGIIETEATFYEDDDDPSTAYHDNVIDVYCSLPLYSTEEGMEDKLNYYLTSVGEEEEWPEWLKWTAATDQYHADYMLNLVQLTADPLPEGVEGRSFSFQIVSDRGAASQIITVKQGTVVEPTLKGDVNGDGIVTITDVTAVINVITGADMTYERTADVNGDGIVTISDVTEVINNIK